MKPIGSPPGAWQLADFEQFVGFDLPQEYRDFLLSLNGGGITIEHDILLRTTPFELGVENLWPFSASSPGLGLREAKLMQLQEKWC
jgi:hypothetical protein